MVAGLFTFVSAMFRSAADKMFSAEQITGANQVNKHLSSARKQLSSSRQSVLFYAILKS